jgi:hypothetical protein
VGSVDKVSLSSDVFHRPGHLLYENLDLNKLSTVRHISIARL